MKKKRIISLFLILIFVFSMNTLFIGCSGGDNTTKKSEAKIETKSETQKAESKKSVEPIVLKLGHKSSENHSWHKASLKFKEIAEEKTNGGVKIDIFPSSQLGDQRTMTEAAQMGVVDIVLDSPAILANFVPEIGVFDLPFVFKDYTHAYETLDTIGMEFDKQLQEQGLKLLAYWETGFKRLSNSKKEITSLEDLAGIKVRTPNSPVLSSTMKAIGCSSVAVAWNETYIALQQGTADGQFNPPSTMTENKIHEVQKYYSDNLTIQYGAEPVVFSLKNWNKLSPEYQEIIQDAANVARDYQRELCQKDDKVALQLMIDSGITVSTISDEMVTELMKMTDSVRQEYASKELLDRISALID